MSQFWDKFKWMGTSLAGLIAGLILFIDPSHIDQLVAAHPKWSGLILFLWTTLVSWANKTKPTQPTVYPPGTGANPVANQSRRAA